MNLATGVLALIVFSVADDSQWSVLKPKEGGPAPSEMLYSYLAEQAHAAWDRRLEEYEKLKTPEQCVARQQQMREFKSSFLAYLLGKSLVGMRTEDVLVCARFLAGYSAAGKPQQVRLAAIGQTGVPALHAAALEPQLFSSVLLRRTINSWEDVVRTPETRNQLVNTVHGALAIYDLPDLVSLAGADKVACEEPMNAAGEPVGNGPK